MIGDTRPLPPPPPPPPPLSAPAPIGPNPRSGGRYGRAACSGAVSTGECADGRLADRGAVVPMLSPPPPPTIGDTPSCAAPPRPWLRSTDPAVEGRLSCDPIDGKRFAVPFGDMWYSAAPAGMSLRLSSEDRWSDMRRWPRGVVNGDRARGTEPRRAESGVAARTPASNAAAAASCSAVDASTAAPPTSAKGGDGSRGVTPGSSGGVPRGDAPPLPKGLSRSASPAPSGVYLPPASAPAPSSGAGSP